MPGVDTVRGIAYQQAQAVLEAIELLGDPRREAIRVEGLDDVVDVEVYDVRGNLIAGKQYKTRALGYTWGKEELLNVMRRWTAVPGADAATFEFVTDGRLGPTGEEVRDALASATLGDAAPLAELLDEDDTSHVVRGLTRAAVRQDPVAVGALLGRAERAVMAMLPASMTDADAREHAARGVDRLFVLLTERAGHPDPALRLTGRREVADQLRVAADQNTSERWATAVRARYLAAAAALNVEEWTPPRTEQYAALSASRPAEERSVEAVLAQVPAVLAGRTGSGKTTAMRILMRDGAISGRPILVAHAEAFLPGRLTALAADAVSEVLDEPMPTATGAQALVDHDAVLVIDGASEVPASIRAALREDLRAHVASGTGAGVVLVG